MKKKKQEHLKKLLLGLAILLIILPGGMHAYSYLEGWNHLDSLYFTVVTVTTIGYGDLVPQTNAGKIFTIIFPFVGITMAFYFFSVIGRKVFESKLKEHHDKLTKHFKRSIIEKNKKAGKK